MGIIPALEFLKNTSQSPIPSVCAIAGDEAFLRHLAFMKMRSIVLDEQEADFSLSRFEGSETTFKDVLRETAMVTLIGSGKRLVVVDQAEPFVSQYKTHLEKYVDEPNKAGVLLLILASFPANTRLYKKIAKDGLVVECKSLQGRQIPNFLKEWAPKVCQASFTNESVEALVDLVGDDLGMLVQETRRLALLAPDGKISAGLVREQGGSWRKRKVWDFVDAALDGKTAEALRQLDKLLAAGEAPIAILAQTSATLRKLAAAAELYLEQEKTPNAMRLSVASVLGRVGVRSFAISKTAEQFKKLGSKRGKYLVQNLLETDLDFKGGSRSDPKIILERFIVMISAPQMRPFDSLL